MKYLSPNSLFGGILVPPLDKKAIQLGRKKMLAELELSDDDTVDIDGNSYDKNEIIRYFEDLLAGNFLEYHNAVSADKVLLGFLQHQQLQPRAQFDFQPIYRDENFIRWISPYFSESFSQLIHEAFHRSDELAMSTLLNNPLHMTVMDQEKIWTEIARLIGAEIAMLGLYFNANRKQVARWRDTSMPISAISSIMDPNHIKVICLLPESRFTELRNKYAFTMMQASIVTFNRYRNYRNLAETWIINAESVAVTYELKNQIVDKLAEFRNIRKKGGSRFFPWRGNFRWIAIAIIVVNGLRLLTGNLNNSSSDFQNTPVILSGSTKDSLLHALIDSTRRSHHEEALPPTPSNQYH